MEYKFTYSKYKLRAYEKKLALLEVQKIIGSHHIQKADKCVKIATRQKFTESRLDRLTFFSEITIKSKGRIDKIVPRQVRHELTAKFSKNSVYTKNEIFDYWRWSFKERFKNPL